MSQSIMTNATPQIGIIDTLIVVCCHAIYLGTQNRDSLGESEESTERKSIASYIKDEANWLIEPFQKGEIPTFITHGYEGLQQLIQTPSAILCFSGGVTKPGRTTRTEAQGYREVAEGMNWFGLSNSEGTDSINLSDRIFAESWATDSYQNVLLSLIQFPLWVQEYQTRVLRQGKTAAGDRNYDEDDSRKKAKLQLPRQLIIVTHAFKRARFTELHLPAIKNLWEHFSSISRPGNNPGTWDLEQCNVIGSDPPYEAGRMKEIEEGNKKKGYGVWENDIYGTGDLLSGKRKARGWDEEKFMSAIGDHFFASDVKRIRKMVQGVVDPDLK